MVSSDKTITFAITWDNARYREVEECFAEHNGERQQVSQGIAKRSVWSALNSKVSDDGGERQT
jgi:hypothetical protein